MRKENVNNAIANVPNVLEPLTTNVWNVVKGFIYKELSVENLVLSHTI
jgi:hypothetical protein